MENDVLGSWLLLDKYEMGERIGEGGTGSVYRAFDRHLKQMVAVKQIVRAEREGIHAESLWNEAEVLKQLEHSALPKIFDYFQEGEYDYMVLEYIHGVTLEQYICENGPVEQQRAIELMNELLGVFIYLHSFSPPIIYRDLKPANIMVRGDGHVKMIDFGAAFMYSYKKSKRVILAGTPGFSAPELLSGKADMRGCLESSDVYSLGAVFHYILTGVQAMPMPFGRRPVREYNGAISDGIEKIILNCMEPEQQKRYYNTMQLRQDLEQYKKLEKSKILKGKIGRTIYLILLAAGIFSILAEARRGLTLPLLCQEGKWKWNIEYKISAELLRGVILIFAGGCGKIVSAVKNRKSRCTRKQEKNVYLTEKKTIGLWGSILFISWILTAMLHIVEAVHAEEIISSELPAVLRDAAGRKLLIKEDAVYKPVKDLILELPLSGLPKGEEVIMQVIVTGKERRYESRKFLIMVME